MQNPDDEERAVARLNAADLSRELQSMWDAEDYLRRGRVHSELSNERLVEKWKIAREACIRKPGDEKLLAVESDLAIECLLRRIKVPDTDDNLNRLLKNARGNNSA